MFARFFIDRPIFAAVLSILIVLGGGIAVLNLPLAQYPPITPATVQVECRYPGASAQVVAESIAAPIEQQVNGVEDMLYMTSQCTSDGSYNLMVTFKLGVNLNLANVLVQNRVNLALPQLPDVVKATGVVTRKRSPDILLVASIYSPDSSLSQLHVSNYATLRLRDEVARLPGISECRLFGQRDYSMRIWVDPQRMSARSITAGDVVRALQEQNVQVSAGQIGQPPNVKGTRIQMVLTTIGRLSTVEEFQMVVVKRGTEGRVVRIKDIGEVELGPRVEDVSNRFGIKKPDMPGGYMSGPAVGLAIFALPDANMLNTADVVKAKMKELAKEFPPGIAYEITYDTTPFIRESINEVVKSLRDAVLLVALVVLVFLQNWRSAVIPLIAVPVAVVGTFAVMLAAGFSLNNLTLFGLVLAIGIVVDDAIVVVEAVEHHIEHGLQPREATIKAMEEVSGPVIAVGLVLSAVFIPCAFITGIIGQFFRQFALTIAISTLLSAFNSLTLSPALAAILLKPRGAKRDWFQWLIDIFLGWFFWLFNRTLSLGTGLYTRSVRLLLRVSILVLVVYGGLLAITWWGLHQLPTGFIPAQDKGYLLASIQLPDSASDTRTRTAISKIEKAVLTSPGVRYTTSVAGNSFMLSAYGSNFGSMFIILDPFEHREDPALSSTAILKQITAKLKKEVPEAIISLFGPPPVSGLGRTGGFKVMIEDRAELGLAMLQQQTELMVDKMRAMQSTEGPLLTGALTVFNANAPQLYVDVNRPKCVKEGVELYEVFSALQVFLGSRYVNDFNLFGRTWQVTVQADTPFRMTVEDVKKLKVRNKRGMMVPLATLCDIRDYNGPLVLTRYNMYPAAAINSASSQGISSGVTIERVEQLAADTLAPGMALEWTEIFYLEKTTSGTGLGVFLWSVVFVFLVLAALYESWSLPLAVILVVPLCVLSSITGVALAKHDVNVFTQVGFVVLIGLACKNAILIVEFAKMKRDQGATAREAALDACKLRLRPILMTSFAFILGVVPLLAAHGAGYEMRRVLGTAVFAGMLGVTIFGIFLTPVFYVVVDWFSSWWPFVSPAMIRLNEVTLDILTARFVWRRASNGNGNGNGRIKQGDPT